METLRDFKLRTYGDKTQLRSRLTIYMIEELEHHGVKTMEPPDQRAREFCDSMFASTTALFRDAIERDGIFSSSLMHQPPDLKQLRESVVDARVRIRRYGRTQRRNVKEKRELNQIKREGQALTATTPVSQEPCQETCPSPRPSPCNTQPQISDSDGVERQHEVERRDDHYKPNAVESRQYELERRVYDLERHIREMERRIFEMEQSGAIEQHRYDHSYE